MIGLRGEAAAFALARRPADAPADLALRQSAAALLLTALAGPFWNVILVSLPGASVTVGRGLIVLTTVLLTLDLRRAPRPLPRVSRAVWLLLGVLGLLWGWTVANTLAWGCRCSGEIAGLSELLALVALVAFVATFEPRLRPLLVFAIIAGAVLAALMTLAGVGGLSAGAQSPATDFGRLTGPYGNPNFLAFAIGFAVPAGIAALGVCSGRDRVVLALALALVSVVLLLTFSRGGLLAVAVGAVLVLVLAQRRGSRAQWLTVAAIAAAGVAATVAYPIFVEQRRESTSSNIGAYLRALDRSGWDASTQGLIPGEPTLMRNPARDVLEVRADGPGRGVSRELPRAISGDSYELRFEARAVTGAQRLRFGLEDNLLGNGPAVGITTLGSAWQALSMRWEPAAESPDARFYIWAPVKGPGFQIRDVTTIARRLGGPPVTTTISPALTGNRFGELKDAQALLDRRDVSSRRVGIELALQAFESHPARGIGWGRFTEYSTANSQFRELPTHNEYLRFLAELGAIGAGLLVLAGLVVASTFWRRRLDAMSLALLGMLVTGAVGLVFVNGLSAAAAAGPLGFATALACARPRAPSSEASLLWGDGLEWHLWAQPRWKDVYVDARERGAAVRKRVRAAVPRPAPAQVSRPAFVIASGVTHLCDAAPAIAPAGWANWLREAERSVLRGARSTERMFEADAGSVRGRIRAFGWRLGPRVLCSLGVGAAALVVRVPLMLIHHEIVPGSDSGQYVRLANTFLDQDSTSLVRPPGYPLFLALGGLLPGRIEDAGVVLQLLIGAALCMVLVFVAWPLFGRLAAITAGVLLALTAPALSVETLLLSDFLFGVLAAVVAGVLAVAVLHEQRRSRWLLAVGLAIACAVYVKPVGHALVLAPLLPLALATRSWRATFAGAALVFVVVGLLTVPWMLRNDIRYGSFSMSAQSGVTLFNRVFERDKLEIPTDQLAGRVAADFQRENPGVRLSAGVSGQLFSRGDTLPEAERKMRAVAIEAIRRSPEKFAAGTVRSTHAIFADVGAGNGAEGMTVFLTHGAPLPALTRFGLGASEPLRAIWFLCALSGLAAALWLGSRSRATRCAAAAAIGVWGSIAVATALLHGGQFRYSASLAPLSFLLGAAGLSVAARIALHLLRHGSDTPWRELLRTAATPSQASGQDAQVGSQER